MRRRSPILVGRDTELNVIRSALDAARGGRGGAVFLVGESGVGKSRLAAAVADTAFHTDMVLMRGRGSSVGSAVPLRPMTEAVLSLVRGYPIDAAALGPYRPILGRLVPDWSEPGADGDGHSPVILAEAVLRLTALAGQTRGCLLCLDDLQDADAESLTVLEYLIDNLEQQPTVVLGTIVSGDNPAWELARSASQRDRCTVLTVRRFGPEPTRAMVAACLGTGDADLPVSLPELVWTGSAGNPFLIEEIVAGLVDDGLLVGGSGGWRLAETLPVRTRAGFAARLVASVDRLSPPARTLLSAAALTGVRFPLAVVQEATGLSDRDLLNHLHSDATAPFVAPDEQAADWYAFRHALTRESVLAAMSDADRSELARTVAKALQTVHTGLPGEWCQVAAGLQLEAGNQAEAGRLYTEAGRRALAEGGANSAVTLLTKAWGLVDDDGRAGTLELLLWALAEAGLVEQALASVPLLDQLERLEPTRQVQLHTRLAWAAAVAGRPADGLVQVEAARRLLGPDADDADRAPVDVVAAHLILDVPGQNQLRRAEELARRAANVSEAVPLPVVGCQAWQLLGALVRHRDPDEATQCLQRARAIAVRYRLPIWEIHALIRLGNDDALREGKLERLEHARQRAAEVGAVTARYQAESSIAFHLVLEGQFEQAHGLIEQILPGAQRLRLDETTTYVRLLRVVLAAHRGRRSDMDEALAEVRRSGIDEALHAPRIYGLARTVCALLEEERDLARQELTVALAADETSPTVFHLAGRFGLHLLLEAMSGTLEWSALEARMASPASRLRWDRQFASLAAAVLHGRAGRSAEASAAVAQALRLGRPYRTAVHLGLRLVSEAALADGWGTPVEWLRRSVEHFDRAGVPAVAGASRAMLRQAGARVGQRRPGVAEITPTLRAAGVTAREFEILRLLERRLSNKEIAQRLQLSPRTVERHISSLLQKTGLTSRIELSNLAADTA